MSFSFHLAHKTGLIFISPIEKFPRGFGLNKSWLKGQRFVHSKADYEKKRKKAFILFTRFSVIILFSKDSKQVLEWLFCNLAWVRANYLIDKNNLFKKSFKKIHRNIVWIFLLMYFSVILNFWKRALVKCRKEKGWGFCDNSTPVKRDLSSTGVTKNVFTKKSNS